MISPLYIIVPIIFIPPIIIIFFQVLYYYLGTKFKYNKIEINNFPSLSILVPTKGEKIETINGLIQNIEETLWDKSLIETIIISDDNEDYFNEMKSKIINSENMKVSLFRRGEDRIGYKSGALLYGYKKSTGDLILTLDVDARLDKNSLTDAYMQLLERKADAVTMNWEGYAENRKSLTRGMIISTYFTNKSIIQGRDKGNMCVFPIGCGTIFKRGALDAVGAWDPNMIQDDLEIGAKLLKAGKKIVSSDAIVHIDVPDTFGAFYVQQTRWSMGAIEVLIRRFRSISSAKLSLVKKLDSIAFLLQYIPIILTFIMGISLMVLIPFIHFDILNNILFPVWIAFLALYAYVFVRVGKKLNFTYKETLISLGRISSYTIALSPFMLLWTFRAFKSERLYMVTPKAINR
jgi:cellulose synthase/poly-beta-1,6-N-acetylglucosamine synthase-like glycosyltransferase